MALHQFRHLGQILRKHWPALTLRLEQIRSRPAQTLARRRLAHLQPILQSLARHKADRRNANRAPPAPPQPPPRNLAAQLSFSQPSAAITAPPPRQHMTLPR